MALQTPSLLGHTSRSQDGPKSLSTDPSLWSHIKTIYSACRHVRVQQCDGRLTQARSRPYGRPLVPTGASRALRRPHTQRLPWPPLPDPRLPRYDLQARWRTGDPRRQLATRLRPAHPARPEPRGPDRRRHLTPPLGLRLRPRRGAGRTGAGLAI